MYLRKMKFLFLLSLTGVCVECAETRFLSALMTGPWKYQIVEGFHADAVLTASFNNSINATGWSFLELHDYRGNRNTSDEEIAYLAGMMEVNLTASLMEMQWQNTMANYCTDNPDLCNKIADFMIENSAYTGTDRDFNQPHWYQVKLFHMQVMGLTDGYQQLGKELLPDYSFIFFQLHGDLDDLASALGGANSSSHSSRHVTGSGSCSALIKLLPDNSDLLIGHDTWTSYLNMIRVFKLYDFKFHVSASDKTVIPGSLQAFSSYPGRLYSGDDFYILGSGLVAMETSIENTNPDLWKYVTPKCVFENVRVVLANRLSTNGKEWVNNFKVDNSGTYNNQWMIVDYKLFVSGKPPEDGLLWILEQMPYYKDIFEMSGTEALVKQYGDWFTWDGAPRAKIFSRNHSQVTDMPSLINLMKYNDFQHDSLAACDCTPPYSGENGIAARSDLNPPNGKYPFSALGHRLHGAIDMKVTNSMMSSQENLSCYASSGPTSVQQPPFQWSTSGNPSGVPLGHPDKWNFDDVLVQWTI